MLFSGNSMMAMILHLCEGGYVKIKEFVEIDGIEIAVIDTVKQKTFENVMFDYGCIIVCPD